MSSFPLAEEMDSDHTLRRVGNLRRVQVEQTVAVSDRPGARVSQCLQPAISEERSVNAYRTQRPRNNSGLKGKYLGLELTESMLMENPEEINRTLKTIKEMGVKISIDDFGTGYSSFSNLENVFLWTN